MARRAALFHVRSRAGYAHFDATIGGRRIREALEGKDGRGIRYPAQRPSREETRAAHEAAEKRYAELVAGRSVVRTERVLTAMRLDELGALWLDAIETPTNKKSVDVKGTYVRHWIAFASDEALLSDGRQRWEDDRTPLERLVSDAGPEDYGMARLGHALRKTVRKEITSLFDFLNWAMRHKHLGAVPPRRALPKGEAGVRTGKQRATPVHIEPEEAHAIIAALPEWSDAARSKRKGYESRAFRVRDVFAFMWEMTWRPSTLARLSVPKNWSRGQTTIVLHDSDDKALYGREVTLTSPALAILERIAPEEGLIFGDHDHRKYIKAAARKVLPAARAKAFARYDFRHGRINNMLEVTGNMLGTAYVGGHKQLTTTNAYLKPQKRQGDAVIAAMGPAATEPTGEIDDTILSPDAGPDYSNIVTDENSSGIQSGRVDSNHRPLDPQERETAQQSDSTGGAVPPRDGDSAEEPPSTGAVLARFGHAGRRLAKTASGFRSVRIEVDGKVVASTNGFGGELLANVEERLKLSLRHGGFR